MEISKQLFILACVIWCSVDLGHTIPSPMDPELSRATEHYGECGKSKKKYTDPPKLTIVGGDGAELGNWPWMVALFSGSPEEPYPVFFCGGSLISRQWVISAARCVVEYETGEVRKESSMFVRLGDLNLNREVADGASPINASVELIVPHKGFLPTPAVIKDDISLIRLKEPVSFTENIHPICLHSGPVYKDKKYYDGKTAFIVGWGLKNRRGRQPSDLLLEALVPVMEQEKCAQRYAEESNILIDEKVICAGEPGKGTCTGDFGGPLTFHNNTDGRFYLGGVVSDGLNCNPDEYPTRFTKVVQYVDWIQEVTGEKF